LCRAAEWGGRLILSKALTQGIEAGKLYAVRWLGVLARIRAPSFAQYGVEFLVEQLKDPSLQVPMDLILLNNWRDKAFCFRHKS
jgi:hypothetical protein